MGGHRALDGEVARELGAGLITDAAPGAVAAIQPARGGKYGL